VDTEQLAVTVQPSDAYAAAARAIPRQTQASPAPRAFMHLDAIVSGWREALHHRHDSPLCALWELVDKRQVQFGQPKHRSAEARKVVNVLACISLLIFGFFSFYLLPSAEGWLTEIQYTHPDLAILLMSLIGLLPFGLLVATVCFCTQLHKCLLICYQFFHVGGTSKFHAYDDLVAVIPLSGQEVLMSCLHYCMRKLRWPLLGLVGSAAVLSMINLWESRRVSESIGCSGPTFSSWELWGVFLSLALLPPLSSLIGCATYIFVALGLSPTPRNGNWPQTGALSMTALQIGLLFMALYAMADNWRDVEMQVGTALMSALVLLLASAYLFYLARFLVSCNKMLTAVWPIALTTITVASVTLIMGLRRLLDTLWFIGTPDTPVASLLFCIDAVSLIPPVSVLAVGPNSLYLYPDEVWNLIIRGFWVLPVRLLLLVFAAEFARDAVHRRKWGAA
jgi:hypothetical protein